MGYSSSGLIEIATYSGQKTTVETRLAMEKGEYRRIRSMRSPVLAGVKEGLTIHRMKQAMEAARAAKAAGNGTSSGNAPAER